MKKSEKKNKSLARGEAFEWLGLDPFVYIQEDTYEENEITDIFIGMCEWGGANPSPSKQLLLDFRIRVPWNGDGKSRARRASR